MKKNDPTIFKNTEIKEAIKVSVSHDSKPLIEAPYVMEAYESLSALVSYCEGALDGDGSMDVWGSTDEGDDFRVRIVPEIL